MELKEVNIEDLKPAEYNPREMTKKQAEDLKNSLEIFGMAEPIVVNGAPERFNVVIGGHQRLSIWRLNHKTIPCVYISIPDIKKEQELNIRLNKNTGQWNFDMLANFEEELLKQAGFDSRELDKIFEKNLGGDDAPPVEKGQAVSKLGEVYLLGRHRLVCGDALNPTHINLLMQDRKADMVFTDPPYLMGFEGNVHADGSKSFNASHGAIKNDKMSLADGEKFVEDFVNIIKLYTKGAYYICFYRLGLQYIFKALEKHDLEYKSIIIWDKGNHTLSNSDYMSKYEPIVYGWINEHKFFGKPAFDIWDVKRTAKNDLHPTMKPVELCTRAIKNSSERNDMVLDLFGGSGSTLIACEQSERTCYTMELDPNYCDVIRKRYYQLIGKENEWQK
jgi:DNA modification methylase